MDATKTGSWWAEMQAIAARYGQRGPSDAKDDLVQELALAALEQGATAERPGAWLERVGRNAAIDRWRGERRRGELGSALEPPPAPPDPEAALLATEQRGVVRRALAALPRPQRRATLLRFHCELPFDAVAARLGTEPATARTRVHRALDGLRNRVRGLRALFVAWPGAQASVAALALIATVEGLPPRATAAAVSPPAHRAAARSSAPRLLLAQAKVAPAPAPPPRARPRPPAPAPQFLDFEGDEVEGAIARPDGDPISSVVKSSQPSLIELRWSLQPEILKSLEEL